MTRKLLKCTHLKNKLLIAYLNENGDEERKTIKPFLRNAIISRYLDVMECYIFWNVVFVTKNLGHNIFCCAKMTNGSSEAEESSTVFAIIAPHISHASFVW